MTGTPPGSEEGRARRGRFSRQRISRCSAAQALCPCGEAPGSSPGDGDVPPPDPDTAPASGPSAAPARVIPRVCSQEIKMGHKMASKGNKECQEQGEGKRCHEHVQGTRKAPVPPGSAQPPGREGSRAPPGWGKSSSTWGVRRCPALAWGCSPGPPSPRCPPYGAIRGSGPLNELWYPQPCTPLRVCTKPPDPGGQPLLPAGHTGPPQPLQEDGGRQKEPQS